MARSAVEDPTKVHRYRLFIDGFQRATFQEVTGLDRKIDVVEYGEGGSETNQKSAGRASFSNITLKRGQLVPQVIGALDMFDWAQQVYVQGVAGNPEEYRRDFDIVQYDAFNAEVYRWTVENGWPCGYKPMSNFNGQASENHFEELEICHEGWRSPTLGS